MRKYHKLKLKIIQSVDANHKILIHGKKAHAYIFYNTHEKKLSIPPVNNFSDFLIKHSDKLYKIFNNKPAHTYYKGFTLPVVIPEISNYPENPFKEGLLAIIDNRNRTRRIRWENTGKEPICQAFTDASYNEKLKKGAYSLIIREQGKDLFIKSYKSKQKGNNLLEMEAVIRVLWLTRKTEKVRITTDSRYVIKGITEWVYIWKLNNWMTASGEKVKHLNFWKKLYRLTKNRYIELKWVKSHHTSPENKLCDFVAKQAVHNK